LGFLSIAGILFTRLGNDEVFRHDVNYWLLMTCGILIVPILLLPFGIIISVFSCAIVGSYTAILAVDRFIGGSVSYIVLNVFKRAIYEDIYMATNQVPFQAKDEILLVAWAVLALMGIALQIYASFGSPPYPTPSNNSGCFTRRRQRARRINLFVSTTNLGPDDDNGRRDSQPSDLEGSDEYVWRISEIRRKVSSGNNGQKSRTKINKAQRDILIDEHSPLIANRRADIQLAGTSYTGSSTPTSSRARSRATSPSSAPSAPPLHDTLIYPDYGSNRNQL